MNEEFWRERWQSKQIGFHEGQPNALLRQFGERLRSGLSAEPRVLVPLCGKTADLCWLAQQGFLVTGVEFVPEATVAFFEENRLPYSTEAWHGLPSLVGGHVRIVAANFFELDPNVIEPFDTAYDRAALVAMPREERTGYVKRLFDLLRPGGRLLLISFAYDPAQMQGPPFSVGDSEVADLFAPFSEFEKLADHDILEAEPRFKERGLTWLREQAWLIRR